MNSKELLIKAKETAEKQLELAGQIEDAEKTIDAAKNGMVCFYVRGNGTVNIAGVVDAEKLEVVKDLALTAIMNYRDDRTKELEQLLGIQPVIPPKAMGGIYTSTYNVDSTLTCDIAPDPVPEKRKPAIINPEFEAAVQEMIESNKNKPDPVEEKLADIIQKQEKEIKDKPAAEDKSLDKFPAQKGRKSTRPEGMTKEEVTRMYVTEKLDVDKIADYYGVTRSIVNNFLFRNQIKRKKAEKKPEKLPEETERP